MCAYCHYAYMPCCCCRHSAGTVHCAPSVPGPSLSLSRRVPLSSPPQAPHSVCLFFVAEFPSVSFWRAGCPAAAVEKGDHAKPCRTVSSALRMLSDAIRGQVDMCLVSCGRLRLLKLCGARVVARAVDDELAPLDL